MFTEIAEAAERPADLVNELEKIPLGRMYQASQRALVRLHLFATGQIHERMLEMSRDAKAQLLGAANKEGTLDSLGGYKAQQAILGAWGDQVTAFTQQLQALRKEAAAIPFGALAMMHDRLVAPIALRALPPNSSTNLGEGKIEEAVKAGVFEPQLQTLLSAAAEHIYGDGLNLSGRIWQMDRQAREGINQIIMSGIANSESAWDVAKQLELFLGANADCPRWTSTRLYNRTKAQIAAGDAGGLIRGDACDGQGVSYNALRLARTEIQKAHALATDRMLAMQPWVQNEQTHLSAEHPEPDECDDVVKGGKNSDGVYPVGTIEYPLHPNCLCYKTADMMPQEEFTSRMRDWLNGADTWPGMDAYAKELRLPLDTDMKEQPVTLSLAVWLFGQALESWLK